MKKILFLSIILSSWTILLSSEPQKGKIEFNRNRTLQNGMQEMSILECIEDIQDIIKAPILFERGISELLIDKFIKYKLPEGLESLDQNEPIKKEMLSLILKRYGLILVKKEKIYLLTRFSNARVINSFPEYKESTAFYDEVVVHFFKLKHINIDQIKAFVPLLSELGIVPILLNDKKTIYAKCYRSTVKEFYEILEVLDVPMVKNSKGRMTSKSKKSSTISIEEDDIW